MATPLGHHGHDDGPAVKRLPGEFQRHPRTGAPWVNHPTRTTKGGWPGTKADLLRLCADRGIDWKSDLDIDPAKTPTIAQLQGLLGPCPARVLYGRPSALGKQIEDQTNLQKWAERMTVLGVATDPLLAADAAGLVKLDPASGEFKDLGDAIARRAKTVAQAHLAAERGTHHHQLTEDVDTDRDPSARMAAGEELGVPAPAQAALIAAWSRMLEHNGLEILATEASCVDDIWCQAGTLDRLCRTTRPLRFVMPSGEIVELPTGWAGILDVKTGKFRLDKAGFVAHWHGYAVQLASYAQSVPYDPDTDERGQWPVEVDQQWAIIAHLDILAALDGTAACRLILVDLAAGRHAGALAVAAKAWENRTDVFSVPMPDLTVHVPVSGTPAPVPVGAMPDFDTPAAPPLEEAIEPPPPPPPAQRRTRKPRLATNPAEGGNLHLGDAFDALAAEYAQLPAASRSWIGRLVNESMSAGVSFRFKADSGERSERRWWIARALVSFASDPPDGQESLDDIVRAWCAHLIGDIAFNESFTLGHIVGSLDVAQAERLAAQATYQISTEPSVA